MTSMLRTAAGWVSGHALAVVAATLVLGAAAGGGIAYASTTRTASPSASAAPGASSPQAEKGPAAVFVHRVLAIVIKDTGLKLPAIRADLAKGESLDQIAGSNATKLESDVVAALRTAMQSRLPARVLPANATSRLAARVHALMSEPGTTLLQQLTHLRNGASIAFGTTAPRGGNPFTVPPGKGWRRWLQGASPSPSPAA